MTVRWELIGATVGERNKLLYHSRAVIRNHLLYQKWIKPQLFAYCFIASLSQQTEDVLWSRQSVQKRCRSLIGLRHNSSITVMSMGRTCRYPPPSLPPRTKKKHMLEESNDEVIVWREDGANHAMQKEPTRPTCWNPRNCKYDQSYTCFCGGAA